MPDEAKCAGDLPAEWYRDRELLDRELAAHGGFHPTARAHGCSDFVLRKWAKRTDPKPLKPGRAPELRQPRVGERARLELDHRAGTGLLVTAPTPEDLGDVDELLRSRGLDPEQWLVDRVTVNEWEAVAFTKNSDGGRTPVKVPIRQLKVHLRRRPPVELLYPAVEVAARHVPALDVSAAPGAARLVWVAGDQQAPYHDEALHVAVLRWLADVQPDEAVLTGDTADFPTISRHPDRPYWNADAQRCVNAAFRLLSDYRDAVPAMVMRKLRGNHDWRLESELLTRAERMFGLKPAELPGVDDDVPLYSIRRLLHLDTLAVELVGREGDKWELAEVEVAPGVAVRHAPPNLKKHARLNRDVVAGHTHRQSLRQVTHYDGELPVVRTLIETGCLCRTDGLGYDEHPDWQAGFVTVAVSPSGGVSYDLATWRNGRLMWRGDTWTA